jgi:tetratricopeptide (TPR) repeat protein
MSKNHDKLMTDLQRLLASQEFKSVDEAKKFMESIMGKPVPSFPQEALSPQERAQDLVFEAYDLPLPQAKKKIEEALKLYPDLIEAYEFLGSAENIAEIAITFYEKGITIGRRIFGGQYLEEHKGMFWGFHETRPFMRCLQQYADCLYTMGKVKECVAVLEEMIELNPNDNQGVRDQLLLYLLQLNEGKKFEKYAKMFKEDCMAFPLFTRALFAFKIEGESDNANKLLKKALKQNKFVTKKLLSKKPITDLADHYGYGDENEADYYAFFAQPIWQNTKGAMAWLSKHAGT